MGTGYEHLLYGRGSSRFPHIDLVRWESRLGELLLSGAGESGLRRRRRAREQAAAPVAVSEAQGEVREIRALPGREAVAGLRLGTPEGAEAQLRVSEGVISNESPMRRIRTLGSVSGERKRGQRGD